MNYKGGVGKTTLTANLAAEIANRGHRVLMIDLDPQTNLTFSFFTVEEWNADLRNTRTIQRWYDGEMPGRDIPLEQLVLTPERVNAKVKENAGQLDLISSHLGLINIDLQLAAKLGATTLGESKRKFLQVHGCLAAALKSPAFADYDLVLIDCPPNFGLVTKTAIVASEYILVPAKADYLSTLGIGYLRHSVDKLVTDYNDYLGHGSVGEAGGKRIEPKFAGVVFTMTQIHAGQPINTQRMQIENTRALGDMPVFRASVRNSPRYFAEAGPDGVPPVLVGAIDDPVSRELRALSDEFVEAIAGGKHRS
ncbi:ParA family protein [Actinoplanes friuliensis]|uniref:Cobyrinic acid a,c-diamide synthase n=1 Tax=Actinoplanes friuliensis DSM 7358 TaxID=1246995 RepID=U5W8J3_9ACTN|nr:AAA family ATPase [Actinoplanes friuliensis]AGZ44300.1 cobyrinic acid a,c-diamide synthase [Actinoplanes friuliensis DSM 7358]